MKKTVLICAGAVLLVLGVGYTLFWGQAMRDAGSLATVATLTEEQIREEMPCFVMATRILGVDVFSPVPASDTAGSAADLARKISRGMYAHAGIGIFVAILGCVAGLSGLLMKNPR